MSDEILEIHTSFGDVAALGQGWVERVDGERVVLPLASTVALGDGVRFVVHLADGTPAFVGAGRCVDVGDRGDDAPRGERYELLVDELQFDERSRPVYEYLVAVRTSRGLRGEVSVQALAPDAISALEPEAGGAGAQGGSFAAALELQSKTGSAPPEDAGVIEVPRASQAGGGTGSLGRASMIPTGALKRPARGLEWEPAAPREPIASVSSGMFQYAGGGIPRPAGPPYPAIARSLWVTPAPRPGAPGVAVAHGSGDAEDLAEGDIESETAVEDDDDLDRDGDPWREN